MAPLKKKRVSKKNKKSWRKNIDIKDVDNFLEDKRLEERLGINYAEQKDEELFHLDVIGKGDNEEPVIQVKVPEKIQKVVGIKEVKRPLRLKETEVPKCFQSLVRRSAVPDPISKRNIPKSTEKKRHPVVKAILQHRLENGILSSKEIQSMKNRKIEELRKKNKPKEIDFKYDVWSKENDDRKMEGCAEWLTTDTIRHNLHNTGKLRRQIPKAILSKTSKLPAVESPHPGSSYNPSLKDHTDILLKAAEAEVKLIEEEKHLNRVTTDMFSKRDIREVENEWFSEMTVGLSMEKTESDEDEGEYKAVNPPVKNKKKTLQKRRKLKEAMALKEKLKQKKIEKKKISDIHRLKKLNEVLDKKEQATLKRMEKRKKLKEQKPYITKTLSQVKYQEPEIEFNLTEQLSGNLRNLQPEGSLLIDRFKSLQKRNILQPTLRRKVKPRKTKKYERNNTKMGWEPKGYEPYDETSEAKMKYVK